MHLENEVDSQVNMLLKNGIVEKSDSPYNNPLVLLRKKNGKLRICVDFRELNAVTKREMYPLPNASDLFDRLSGQEYFTTIDLSKGYYQIKLDENSQEKTAFSTSQGHFKFTRLPFGLTSAPAAFQSAIENILSEEKYHKCAVYIDDIIIYGKSRKEHDYNLLVILNKLLNAGVKLSKEKFQFCKRKIKYLGHIISSKGIEKDPEKLIKLENWPRPTTMKELNSFLGFANYYRKFVRDFSQIASPLEKLVKKDKRARQVKLSWSDAQESSFIRLKNALKNAPLLHPANANDTFLLDVDASKFAIGGVLSQIDQNGVEKPVYFASNKLSQAEQHYCATRRELLSVVRYVKFFHHYLAGKRFIVRTDHKSLTWLMKWKTPPSSQYFRWLSILQEYDFSIIHRDGKDHLNADALSRLPFCKQCKVEHINAVNHDDKHRTIDDKDLIKLTENLHRQFCHIGRKNLTTYLSSVYKNKNLGKICKNVCDRCIVCLKRKATKSIKTTKGSLSAKESFQKMFMDIAGPLPNCDGYRYILVFIDSFSNFPVLCPLKSLETNEVAANLMNNWISNFGAPRQIHSDNALYFSGPEMKRIYQNFDIIHTTSAPYYPKGNGKVERSIRTIKDMLFCLYTEGNKSWVENLKRVEMTLRGVAFDSYGVTPFEYIFGNKMRITNFKEQLEISEGATNRIIDILQENQINVPQDVKINPGDYIMTKIFPIQKSILLPRYDGPFKVIQVKSNGKHILAKGRFGEEIRRNIEHVKKLHFSPSTQTSSQIYFAKPNIVNTHSSTINSPPTAPSQHPAPPTVQIPPNSVQQPDRITKSRYPKRVRILPQRYGFNNPEEEGV